MEAGIFVAWNWQMIIVLVVTLLQNWLAGRVDFKPFKLAPCPSGKQDMQMMLRRGKK